MIKETECQKLVVKAVEEVGGAALMLNNRYLVGVADLMVKLPDAPMMILEAKRTVVTPKYWDESSHKPFSLAVTKLQNDFLKEWDYAGVRSGIASFVIKSGSDVSGLHMTLYTLQQDYESYYGVVADHLELGGKHSRFESIRNLLREFVA